MRNTALLCMIQLVATQVRVSAFVGSAKASARSFVVVGPSVLGRRSWVRFSSSNVNGESWDKEQQRRPQTGWTHSQPSKDSDFWKGGESLPNKKARSSRRRDSSSSSAAKEEEPRTGWLHNTKPKGEEKPTASVSEQEKKKKSGVGNMARRRLEMAKLEQERNHRILSPPTFHACGEDRVVAVTEHLVSVPVFRDDESSNDSSRMDVYFSIVERVNDETRAFLENELSSCDLSPNQRVRRYVEHAALQNADGMVLYLQGGPGFGAPTPAVSLSLAKGSGSWADAALHTHGFQRVVLMDQRGTGKSTPITKQTLERKFPDLFLLDKHQDDDAIEHNRRLMDEFVASQPEETERVKRAVDAAVDYLAQFRADNIVQDAEYVREALMVSSLENEEADQPASPRPWGCSLGQSYGGFCQMTYLSTVEYPPKIMLFTGGIAPMLSDVEEVYTSLWERVKERSLRYYEMYPGDIALVHTIVEKLLDQPAHLPSGGRLTARRFLALGIALGGSPSSFASFHELLSSAFVGGVHAANAAGNVVDLEFTRSFLKQMDTQQSFDDHPLYYWMHETIYADGSDHSPTSWAAERAYNKKVSAQNSDFDYRRTSQLKSEKEPTLFFGEMVFSWMPEDFAELSGVGLRAVADALANKTDWGPLYDADHMKMVLENGRTRSAASVYHEDMYVDFDACMKVTARGGPLGRCKLYVTNEYQHSGLRDSGAALFSKLYGMAKGGIRTPS